jgi:hypothetical protein
MVDMAADEIAERRRRALVRYVHQVQSENRLEHFGIEVMEGAGPGVPKAIWPGELTRSATDWIAATD